MAKPTPKPVISPRYCHPDTIVLKIEKAFPTATEGNAVVTDTNGKKVFQFNAALLTLHNRRILCDAASGDSLLTLHKKIMTLHDRWEAFKGESTEPSDLLFSVKRHSVWQLKFKFTMDVFLAKNKKEEVCDFKIEARWYPKTVVVYSGDSSTVLAEMEKRNGSCLVTVQANTDSAFITGLIQIVDDIFVQYSTRRMATNILSAVDPTPSRCTNMATYWGN